MSADGKLRVLAQIANRLNAAEIQWALGASAMLYWNGVADRFDPIWILWCKPIGRCGRRTFLNRWVR